MTDIHPKLEAVARIICANHYCPLTSCLDCKLGEKVRLEASAIIEALLDPTEDQVETAARQANEVMPGFANEYNAALCKVLE